ncbi:ABC transporter-related protein [Chthoniobacter flavus Ellin428]|uniref:ABC transporter-related protein n=1 Tax=Chthoniobacter flavus Ellin428 TaxID=497964 RepID=B4D9W9_9BACT|nr:ABC transporter ATP-binding protein [Chthoniobacter flavus]EDY16783.1 ABC transporter-related protein [Chthoniobacter flavus Ellin428]TCO86697.1 iron(III) transport system ATP-binding protein [Chthoniobacter flavus]
MISLTIDQVTKRFGDTVALHQLDLKIEPGEIFFLLGPSGCGKTTLLRSIAGFIVPEEGRIFFGTEDVTHQPPHRRNTGMMFQSYALWPHLTVAQNVAFGLEERKLARPEIEKRVAEALALVKLEGLGGRKIHQLSGGQQQRVALARALVIRPQCLLLDEPLSNLDAKLRLEMRTEIRRICKEFGLTAIYVTHDQKEALSIADRMAILEGGHIRQIGKPVEVYRAPVSRFVADFMGETNFIDGRVKANNYGLEVETLFGLFSAVVPAKGSTLKVGDECVISIRPESWQLSTTAPKSNTVAGRIEDCMYLGETAQYRFTAAGGALKIYELNPRFVGHGSDREVFASVSPDDVVVLPR